MLENLKNSKVIALFLVLFLALSFLTPLSVFAEDEYWKVCTITNQTDKFEDALKGTKERLSVPAEVTGTGVYVKDKGEYKEVINYDNVSKVVKINKTNWDTVTGKNRDKALKAFIDEIYNSDMDEEVKQDIMNNFQEVNDSVNAVMFPIILEASKANMFEAYKIAKPFLDILNIVLGIGSILLILLLLFSTVMDLVYIGLPVWRESQNEKSNGKNPFGVSYEAMRTVQEVEKGLGGGDGEYRNAYLLYFKRRSLTYIILAICLFYLICGGLSGIIGFVLHLVSGITGA